MNHAILKDKLLRAGNNETDVNRLINYVVNNSYAINLTKEDYDSIKIVAVFKNSGGVRIFKLIDSHIVEDKLDISFSDSRDLICISNWNIKKAYSISLDSSTEASLHEIQHKQWLNYLYSIVKPTTIKYVAMLSDGSLPAVINVDLTQMVGLSYEEFHRCLNSTYTSKTARHISCIDVQYYVISYSVDE